MSDLRNGRGTFTLLTQDCNNSNPVWSPTPSRPYASDKPAWKVASIAADGSSAGRSCGLASFHAAVLGSPDGKKLAVGCSAEDAAEDVYVLQLDGGNELRPFVSTPFSDWGARFSRDGKWIAYVSDTSGQYEVYVRPYPGPGSQWQISTGGGEEPTWSHDGREIFYRSGTKWMAAPSRRRAGSLPRRRRCYSGRT